MSAAPLLRLPFSVVVAVDSAILMVPLGGSSSHHQQNPTTTTTTTTLPLTVWEIPQQQQQPTLEEGQQQQQQQPCPPPVPLLLPNNSSTSPPVFYSELDRAWHPYPESYRVQLHIPNMKDVYFAIRHSDSNNNNNNNNNKLFQMSWCESKTSAPPQYSVVSGKSPTEVWTTFLLRVHHRLTADVRAKLPRSGLEAVGLTNATVLRALGHKKQQHNNKSSAATTTATIAGVVTIGDAKTNLQAMTTTAAGGVVQQKSFRIRDAFPAPAHDDWGAIRRLANTIAADDRAVELATEMARKAQAEKKAAAERARERAIRAILLEYDNGTMISSPSMTSMDDDEDDDMAAGLDVRLMRRARRDAGKPVGESSPKLHSRGGGGGGRGRKQKAQASKRPLFPLKESRVGSDYQVSLCGGGGMRMRDPMDMGGTPLLLPDDEEFLHWKDTEDLLVVDRNRSRNKKRKAAGGGGGGGGGGFTAAATAKLARRQELVIAQAAAAVAKVRETTMPPFPASSFFNAYLTLLQQPEDKVYSSWLAERVGDFAKYCGMPGVRTDGRKKVRKLAEFCA